MKIVLASQSPRRKELLGRLVSAFDVHPADIDETLAKAAQTLVKFDALALAEEAGSRAVIEAVKNSSYTNHICYWEKSHIKHNCYEHD